MSTWLQDLQKTNPVLAEDYKIVGNQSIPMLKNMIKALEMFGGGLNTVEENLRLAAAKRIVKESKKRVK